MSERKRPVRSGEGLAGRVERLEGRCDEIRGRVRDLEVRASERVKRSVLELGRFRAWRVGNAPEERRMGRFVRHVGQTGNWRP